MSSERPTLTEGAIAKARQSGSMPAVTPPTPRTPQLEQGDAEPETVLYCSSPTCKKAIELGAKFCPHCRTPVVDRRTSGVHRRPRRDADEGSNGNSAAG